VRCAAPAAAVLLLAASLAGCIGQAEAREPVDVVASVDTLAYFADRIAAGHLRVGTLVPPGVAAYDWEPSATDLAWASGARLFLYAGAGLEPWAPRLAAEFATHGTPSVEASQGIPLVVGGAYDKHASEGDEDERNPYVWLDPFRAQALVANIAQGLARLDPANGTTYDGGARDLQEELQGLLLRSTRALRQCAHPHLVVTSAAYDYLEPRYGISTFGIGDAVGRVEPSPMRLGEMVDTKRFYRMPSVFYEAYEGDTVARALAAETGAQVFALHNLGTRTAADQRAGLTYFALMDQNLATLREGLHCL
jgi:zinc transport system substrate-binding protein